MDNLMSLTPSLLQEDDLVYIKYGLNLIIETAMNISENVVKPTKHKLSQLKVRRKVRKRNNKLMLNHFIEKYKVSFEKILQFIKKSTKFYKLCKSRKQDKIIEKVVSHKLNKLGRKQSIEKIKVINRRFKRKRKLKILQNNSLEIQPLQPLNIAMRNKINNHIGLLREKRKVNLFSIIKPIRSTNKSLIINNKIEKFKSITENEACTIENNKIESEGTNYMNGNLKNSECNGKNTLIDNDSVNEKCSITLTKTSDITKIKGWRSKQFLEQKRTLTLDLNNTNSSVKKNGYCFNRTNICDLLSERANKCADIDKPSCSKSYLDHPENINNNFHCNLETANKNNDVVQVESEKKETATKESSQVCLEDNLEKKSTSTNSAFISEALDRFLLNAKLNISYEVPKLIAEENITNIKEENVSNVNVPASTSTSYYYKSLKFRPFTRLDVPKKCKAKTLAEKRRMIETDHQRELMHEMEINETTILKQLRREEKRNRIETIVEIRKILNEQSMPVTRECWTTVMKSSDSNNSVGQVVNTGNEIIRVAGSYNGNSININGEQIPTSIKYTPTLNVIIYENNKNSRMKYEPKNRKSPPDGISGYRPGPLSRKPYLDQNDDDKWETIVTPLPQPTLKVYPEHGKIIPPFVEGFIQGHMPETGYVTRLWAEYSAEAVNFSVKNENATPKEIVFPLSYTHGQNKVIMKRKKPKPVPKLREMCSNVITTFSIIKREKSEDVEDVVQDVITDILNYLDTPILDNSTIKFCPDCPEFRESTNDVTRQPTPIPTDVHAVLSSSKKRTNSILKTERELKRLSVQVIEVDVKPQQKVKGLKKDMCQRLECKLGCVCNDSDSEWPQHCGREGCMLKCECPTIKMVDKQKGHHYISLPEGSNILCAKTMGQLRDQAKRNLAKEERKFTQTVIKSNDQTIVVGEGCRERRKRVTKLPQKYEDFVNSSNELKKIHSNTNLTSTLDDQTMSDEDNGLENVEVRKSIRIWDKDNKIEVKKVQKNKGNMILSWEAVVYIKNMVEVGSAAPWCMIHRLYKCFCEGQALEYDTLNEETQPRKSVMDKEKENEDDIEYIEYSSNRSHINANPFAAADVGICARIRGVPNFYLGRNKSQYFKMRNAKIIDVESKQSNLLDTILIKSELSSEKKRNSNQPEPRQLDPLSICQTTESDSISDIIKVEDVSIKNTNSSTNSSLLKEERVKSKSTPSLGVIHKRKSQNDLIAKCKKARKSIPVQITPKEVPEVLTNMILFKTIDQQSNNELTIIQVKNNRLPDLLIPMPHIQNHFRQVVFKYSNSKNIFRLICWATLRRHFHSNNIFIWFNPITSGGKLIVTRFENERPSGNFCNIKFLKNASSDLPEIVMSLTRDKLPGKALIAENTFGILVYNGTHWEIRGTILRKPTDGEFALPEDMDTNLQMKPMIKVRDLPLESKEVPLTIAEPDLPKHKISPTNIRVPIPLASQPSRWFMLILENDFSILRILNSQNVIKYSQLKQACEGAMKHARTVRYPIPRDRNGQNRISIPTYGVYAVPGLLERVFFGPYNMTEDHGIVTYRYLNGKLVNTQVVDRFYGSDVKKSKGIWLFTKGYNSEDTKPPSNSYETEIPFVDLTDKDDDNEVTSDQTSVANSWPSSSPSKFEILSKAPDDVNMALFEYASLNKRPCDVQKRPMPVLERIDSRTSSDSTDSDSKMPTLQPMYSIGEDDSGRKIKPNLNNISCDNDDDLARITSSMLTRPENQEMWLISEPPNLGYIQLRSSENGQILLKSPLTNKDVPFTTMGDGIEWIDKLLRRYIDFVPPNFQVRMYLVHDKSALVGHKPLREDQLRGFHMICRKGLFDILHLSSEELETMGFSQRERTRIMEKKSKLIPHRYLYDIAECFMPSDDLRRKNWGNEWPNIVKMAPGAIMKFKKENIELKQKKRALLAENDLLCKKYLDVRMKQNTTNIKSHIVDLNKILRGTESDDDDDVIIVEDTPVNINASAPLTNGKAVSHVPSPDALTCTYNRDIQKIVAPCKIQNGQLLVANKKETQPYPVMLTEINSQKTVNIRSPPNILDSETIENAPIYAPVLLPDGRSILVPIETRNKQLSVASSTKSEVNKLSSGSAKKPIVSKPAPQSCKKLIVSKAASERGKKPIVSESGKSPTAPTTANPTSRRLWQIHDVRKNSSRIASQTPFGVQSNLKRTFPSPNNSEKLVISRYNKQSPAKKIISSKSLLKPSATSTSLKAVPSTVIPEIIEID